MKNKKYKITEFQWAMFVCPKCDGAGFLSGIQNNGPICDMCEGWGYLYVEDKKEAVRILRRSTVRSLKDIIAEEAEPSDYKEVNAMRRLLGKPEVKVTKKKGAK